MHNKGSGKWGFPSVINSVVNCRLGKTKTAIPFFGYVNWLWIKHGKGTSPDAVWPPKKLAAKNHTAVFTKPLGLFTAKKGYTQEV